MAERSGASEANVEGTSIVASAISFTASSPSVTTAMMRPFLAFTSSMLLMIFCTADGGSPQIPRACFRQ